MSRNDFLSTFKRVSFNFPSKLAVCYVSEASSAPLGITYCELNRVTDDLSHFFSKFFEHGKYIAVRLTERLWLCIIILSIWKSGNAFSGLADHFTPTENEKLLERLKVSHVISDTEMRQYELVIEFWICHKKFFLWRIDAKEDSVSDWDMCYGIMTSGSTGIPKVVQVPWSCILPNAKELTDIFQIDSDDSIYQLSPCMFDPFFIDLFLAFTTGASLILAKYFTGDLFFAKEKKISYEHGHLKKYENQFICDILGCDFKKITFVQTTPSLFLKWGMDTINNILLNSTLKTLVLGGERYPKEIFHPKSSVKFYNIYGITEISCWAFLKEIKTNKEASIGKPLNGITYKIENDELFIGSKNRKCLVGDDDHFQDEEIVYRATGDLVKIVDDEIYFLCRNNQIIKRFGIKIDLNKIEKEFLSNGNTKACRCLFDDSYKKLLIFLVLGQEHKPHLLTPEEISENKLQETMSKLADTEKPDRLIGISSLPVNPNGKCDGKKLLEISRELFRENRTIREKFYEIWTGVLNSPAKNFWEAGGNSVLALLMTNRMDDAEIKVPKNFLEVLFEDGDFENCLKVLQDDFGEVPAKKLKISGGKFCLDVSWKFDLKKCVDASPVVAQIDGKWSAIVGSHSSLLSSIEIESGIENWTTKLGDRIESGCRINKSSTLGFIGSYDCCIYCISLLNGEIVWKYKTGDMIKSTPCFSSDEEIVFVASYDTYLYCLSSSTGTLLKRLKLGDKGIYCSGIVSHDLKAFYIGTLDGTCASIHQRTNEIVWKNKLNSPIFASPCLHEKFVIFIEVLGRVVAYSAETGYKIWAYELNGNVYSSPVVHENVLLFGCHDRSLYCLMIKDDGPVLKFRSEYDSPIFASPRLIKFEEEILIAVASTKGFVYLSNFDSGKVVSNFKLPGEIFSSPSYNGVRLIVGCRDNYLYCLKFKRLSG